MPCLLYSCNFFHILISWITSWVAKLNNPFSKYWLLGQTECLCSGYVKNLVKARTSQYWLNPTICFWLWIIPPVVMISNSLPYDAEAWNNTAVIRFRKLGYRSNANLDGHGAVTVPLVQRGSLLWCALVTQLTGVGVHLQIRIWAKIHIFALQFSIWTCSH